MEDFKVVSADLQGGNGNKCRIVLQCVESLPFPSQIEKLGSAAARNAAIRAAVKENICGSEPGISATINPPHPLNSDDEIIENLVDEKGDSLPPAHARQQPAKYQVQYEVTGKL
jgi:hypothetical protein